MSQLTVKFFLLPDQHILSTKENLSRIKKKKKERERKAKEVERAEAARRKEDMEAMKARKPLRNPVMETCVLRLTNDWYTAECTGCFTGYTSLYILP